MFVIDFFNKNWYYGEGLIKCHIKGFFKNSLSILELLENNNVEIQCVYTSGLNKNIVLQDRHTFYGKKHRQCDSTCKSLLKLDN